MFEAIYQIATNPCTLCGWGFIILSLGLAASWLVKAFRGGCSCG